MPRKPVFTITYWGITGTMSSPLMPAQVTDRIVDAVERLVETGNLAGLQPGPELADHVRKRVEQLSFPRRSTYGGNTTCLELQTPDALLILDCGTGFRELGQTLARQWDEPSYRGSRAAHVLVTHPHLDHVEATPYFSPYYDPRNEFIIWASRRALEAFSTILNPAAPLSGMFFPPTSDMMKGLRECREVTVGSDFSIGSTRVRTYALNHPGGCLGYRFENAGRSFVFATDHEHKEVPDRGLAAFAQGADLLYMDGQYLAAEYEGQKPIPGDRLLARRGWGHSTVESCVATAAAAEAKLLHIGHVEPQRTDDQIADIERYAQRLMAEELRRHGGTADDCRMLIPYEGMRVEL